jgi:hypothetical protein
MIKMLLGLAARPAPHDAADALAVAICHLHSMPSQPGLAARSSGPDARVSIESRIPNPESREAARRPRSWRQYRPPANG